jgi:hypothetical protein
MILNEGNRILDIAIHHIEKHLKTLKTKFSKKLLIVITS